MPEGFIKHEVDNSFGTKVERNRAAHFLNCQNNL